MSTAVFKITDGTNSVDLLELREGVAVQGWMQAVATYKGGGTFQQSSLSDGRRLVDKHFDAIQESVPIPNIAGGSQDITISILHDLFALMEKASDYWASDWCDTPVWLELRAECETNTRYALVVTAFIPNIADIYAPSAFVSPDYPLTDMQLIIEREHWTGNAPGIGTATEISAVEAYGGVSYGNVDDSGVRDPVTSGAYLTNMRGVRNYTHIYTWSAANGFSANLLGGPFPYDLIDVAGAAPAVNDLLYFGIQTNVPAQWPRSLVLDIGTAQTGISLAWEYWTGAAWVAITSIQDNTATAQPLDTAGVNSVHWAIPTLVPMGAVNVNGVNAYWIRARVTAVPGPVVAPTQQNRNPYMIDWPYTEIQAIETQGDIPALTRIKLAVESHNDGGAGEIDNFFYNRVIMGLRSMARGTNFTAYLNADNQAAANPTGITFSAAGGAFTVANLVQFATVTNVGNISSAIAVAATDAFTWTLAPAIAPEYYGTFRAYALYWFSNYAAPNLTTYLKVKLGAGGETLTSPTSVTLAASTTTYLLVDYGKVTIPQPGILTTADPMTVELTTNIELLGAVTGALIHLVLIPVDEWALDTEDVVNDADSTVEEGRYLDIDSVVNPKIPLRSLVRQTSDEEVTGIYLAVKNGPAIMQRAARQRLWALMCAPLSAGSTTWVADIRTCASVQIERQQRYLGPRGTL